MNDALRKTAARQYGLFTRAQWRACGLSDRQLDGARARKDVVRRGNSVYSIAGTPVTFRQRCLAACLSAGDDAVITGASWAVLFGISAVSTDDVHFLVRRGGGGQGATGVRHRTTDLPRRDITSIHGIPALHPARALCELARLLDERALEEVVDDVVIRKLTTLARIERRCSELSGSGREGTALLRRVLSTWSDDMPQEVVEMRLIRRLVAAGLPRPDAQVVITDAAGRFLARADIGWPWAQVAIEMKSARWHGTPSGLRRDVTRDNRVTIAGWKVLDATPADLRGPATELTEQAAVLLAAARQGA